MLCFEFCVDFCNCIYTFCRASLDLRDEYGRTALIIAVWRLSASETNLTFDEVHKVRALLEYGFNPFVKFRGKTIEDKLTKIVKAVTKCQDERNLKNLQTTRQTTASKEKNVNSNQSETLEMDENTSQRSRNGIHDIAKCSKRVELLLDTFHNGEYVWLLQCKFR